MFHSLKTLSSLGRGLDGIMQSSPIEYFHPVYIHCPGPAADRAAHWKVASSLMYTNQPLQNIKAFEQRRLESFNSGFSGTHKSE